MNAVLIRIHPIKLNHVVAKNAHSIVVQPFSVDKTGEEDSFIDVNEFAICSGDWRFKISHLPCDEMAETRRNYFATRDANAVLLFEQKRKSRFSFRFDHKKPRLE